MVLRSKRPVASATLLAASLFAAVNVLALAQSTAIPASSPTSAQGSVSSLPSANPQATISASHLAVLWDGVVLQVDATNVPLSRVLREISLKTKLHITGTAPDERIFGTYGPGPMNLVVPALLDGLSINMLLTERTGGVPSDLSLTARSGGPTPSAVPTQQAIDDTSTQPPTSTGFTPPTNGTGQPTGSFVPRPRVNPNGTQSNGAIAGPTLGDNGISGSDNGINGPNSGVNGADNGIGVAPSGTDANTTDPASPNGVRTPQEIFEQLQKLRQQQSQPQQ